MRALLVLSEVAGRTTRTLRPVLAWLLRAIIFVLLSMPYAAGCICGFVISAALSVAAAARLGWQDGRKAGHGAA